VGAAYVQYVQDLNSPLSQILQVKSSSATTTYQYGWERFAASSAGVRSWVVGDRLGSVRLNLSDTAAPLGTSSYDPWGQPILGNRPAPFGFTGEFQSPVSGLEYLRARWYNPRSGTLLGRDPFAGIAEKPYSTHPHQYGYSNPVSNTDPTGMMVQSANTSTEVFTNNSWDFTIRDRQINICDISSLAAKTPEETIINYLSDHSISIRQDPVSWTLDELSIFKEAIEQWEAYTHWSLDQFDDAFDDVPVYREHTSNGAWYNPLGWIYLTDWVFSGRPRDHAKATIIHELAHRWDDKSSWANFNPAEFHERLVIETDGTAIGSCYLGAEYEKYWPGEIDAIPSEYAKASSCEDFAESVTVVITPMHISSHGFPVNPKFWGSIRDNFVNQAITGW
jgi:RHS repeat-associated protein